MEIEKIFLKYQPYESVTDLFGKVIGHGFSFHDRYGRLCNKLISSYRFFVERPKTPGDLHKVADRLVPLTLVLQQNDKTCTFKKMRGMGCILKHRALGHYIKTPFIDSQHKFMLSEHKFSCFEFAVLIFSAQRFFLSCKIPYHYTD